MDSVLQAVTGNTPLHMAVLHGDAKMTSEMVAALQDNGGDVDVPNSNGDTVCDSHRMLSTTLSFIDWQISFSYSTHNLRLSTLLLKRQTW